MIPKIIIIDLDNVRELITQKKWETADGNIMMIKDMSNDHIKNTINFLNNKSKFYNNLLPKIETDMYIELLQQEIINRP